MSRSHKPKQIHECALSELAQMFGLSLARITQMHSEGVVIKTESGKANLIESVNNYIEKLRAKSKPAHIATGDVPAIEESKARREAAQAGLAELKLAEAKMALIPIAEVDERDAKIAGAVRSSTLKQRAELPPRLEGLQAYQIASVLDEYNRSMLEELADSQSEFWQKREKLVEAENHE